VNFDRVAQVLEMAIGGFAIGWANDSYVAPFLETNLPFLQSNHLPAKVTDAATTGVTTFAVGQGLRALNLGRVARAVEGGGYFVTALKALAIPIPGAEVKLTVPSPLSLFRSQAALPSPADVKQLGSGGSGAPYAFGNALSVPAPANAAADWGA